MIITKTWKDVNGIEGSVPGDDADTASVISDRSARLSPAKIEQRSQSPTSLSATGSLQVNQDHAPKRSEGHGDGKPPIAPLPDNKQSHAHYRSPDTRYLQHPTPVYHHQRPNDHRPAAHRGHGYEMPRHSSPNSFSHLPPIYSPYPSLPYSRSLSPQPPPAPGPPHSGYGYYVTYGPPPPPHHSSPHYRTSPLSTPPYQAQPPPSFIHSSPVQTFETDFYPEYQHMKARGPDHPGQLGAPHYARMGQPFASGPHSTGDTQSADGIDRSSTPCDSIGSAELPPLQTSSSESPADLASSSPEERPEKPTLAAKESIPTSVQVIISKPTDEADCADKENEHRKLALLARPSPMPEMGAENGHKALSFLLN
jgi:hypothetical protein